MNGWIGVKYVLRIAYSFKVFDKMNKIKITTILAIVDAKLKYII